MWEQRIQLGGGASGGQLREDVGQVRKWRNAVLRAGSQQTVESGSPSGRVMRSAEEIIAPAQCDIAQLALTQVVVTTEATVFDESRQRGDSRSTRRLSPECSTPSLNHSRFEPLAR
jgi:hypothetical protein